MSFSDAAHLLRRAGVGGRRAEIQALVGLPGATAVAQVLATGAPQAPSDTPGRLAQPEVEDEAEYVLWVDMVQYWLDRLAGAGSPIQEKLTLFWHGHFVSEQNKIYDSRRLWQQNQLFRREGMGSFQTLVQHVAIDPAMLKYLDNAFNTKGNQQENWAREMMELFTLGVDQYSQGDVVSNARAWTGHGLVDPYKFTGQVYEFHPTKHDDGADKTIFGITKNWNGPDVLNEICAGVKRDTMARFIAAKVWSFFAYPNPDAGIVDTLAAAFVANGLSVTELVRSVFLHDAFWSPTARNGLVRSPAEYVAAVMRGVNRPASDLNPQWYMAGMGQELFNPPNVSGWRPNGYWLSTAAVSARSTFARNVMWSALDTKKGWGFPLTTDMCKKSSGVSNEQIVTTMLEAIGVYEPTGATWATLVEYVAANRSKWFVAHNLFVAALTCPEMHLA
jgi:uncharacterized protein (DUF1800 family)